jgi:hypothetical protein
LWIWVSFKINQKYIAANLCVNRFEAIPLCKGSCFLEKQLNQNQKQQQKFPDLKLKEITLFFFDNKNHQVQNVLLNIQFSYPTVAVTFLNSGHLRSVFRPPSTIA